jgi:L-asparaginase II
VYTAILPQRGIGIAVKIADGNARASEAVITGMLVDLGALDAQHPAAQKRLGPTAPNCRGTVTGHVQLTGGFFHGNA